MESAGNEIIDPEELEELERDAVELQARLEEMQGAEMMSEAVGKVVTHINETQEGDMLAMGREENRWKELIVEKEVEPEMPQKTGCCTIA